MAGVLKVKDPADPTGTTWIEVAGVGAAGATGAAGASGPTGPTGAPGPSLFLEGNVPSGAPGTLPPGGPVNPGGGYIDDSTSHFWVWDGTGWIDAGPIAGPPGVDGAPGDTGPAGATGPIGPTGPPLPVGGAVWAPLVKKSAADGDVAWADQVDNFVSLPYRGAFQFTGSGGGLFWRGAAGDEANRAIVIREASGKQPRIAEGDGTNERDIIDTTNGDARYYRSGSTNHTITWISGWSGTCEYRVSSSMVTCTMEGVGFNAATVEPARVKMHAYPSGVPAPWRRLWTTVTFDTGTAGGWYNPGNVEFNTDGVWLNVFDNRAFANDQQFRCSMSWAR